MVESVPAKVKVLLAVSVLFAAMLKVFPPLFVTVNPFTCFALKAYGTAVSLTLVPKVSPLKVISKYKLSELKSTAEFVFP
ncbi:MAG: hypothetical protein UR81_C0031G0005 [Candidatus Levybacteria bacterium GW2011_GWB1_35_5]|nr:MAG: hypothetical protein UR81_C0031G0005 [Candidatus Levybacteria bacterium GW2011_GWB1_35_5]